MAGRKLAIRDNRRDSLGLLHLHVVFSDIHDAACSVCRAVRPRQSLTSVHLLRVKRPRDLEEDEACAYREDVRAWLSCLHYCNIHCHNDRSLARRHSLLQLER